MPLTYTPPPRNSKQVTWQNPVAVPAKRAASTRVEPTLGAGSEPISILQAPKPPGTRPKARSIRSEEPVPVAKTKAMVYPVPVAVPPYTGPVAVKQEVAVNHELEVAPWAKVPPIDEVAVNQEIDVAPRAKRAKVAPVAITQEVLPVAEVAVKQKNDVAPRAKRPLPPAPQAKQAKVAPVPVMQKVAVKQEIEVAVNRDIEAAVKQEIDDKDKDHKGKDKATMPQLRRLGAFSMPQLRRVGAPRHIHRETLL